jgi:hypothetical protein
LESREDGNKEVLAHDDGHEVAYAPLHAVGGRLVPHPVHIGVIRHEHDIFAKALLRAMS